MIAILKGIFNRTIQIIVRFSPGERSLRITLHRLRGVKIGDGCAIGTDALIETAHPHLVSLGDRVYIGIRTTIIGHFRDHPSEEEIRDTNTVSVRIEDDAFVGPGCVILPNVTIGEGSVVNAGSVVTRSVAPLTMVQGNPAEPIARCGVPLGLHTPLKEFYRRLKPISHKKAE